jgi:hypothetical protein
MRPTGLGHGVYKDSIDYSVFSGEWLIGRIYERKGFPNDGRFFLVGLRLTRPPAYTPMAPCEGGGQGGVSEGQGLPSPAVMF